VLGLPPQLTTDTDNLVLLLAYFLVTSVGVWALLRRADSTYGNLYGRMTDAEIKAIRIERDLGDPARLLNDLADEGLDLTAVLGQRAPSSASELPSTPEKGQVAKTQLDDSTFLEQAEVSGDA